MFNFLKLKKETQEAVVGNYPKIVHEIHNEFLTAGDRILAEAKMVLEESKQKSIGKGKRLSAVGFDKCPEAVEAITAERRIILTKEMAELVKYYQINYPDSKFIAEDQVSVICKKYGLVCGEISMYRGFVPENKLSKIESFRFNKNDRIAGELSGSNLNTSIYNEHIGNVGCDEIKGYWKDLIIAGSVATFTKGNSLSESFSARINSYFNLYTHLSVSNKNAGLKICAPLKDMEIPKGKEIKGYKIQDIPDPVVLQPVKGGYLIVTAWGDEASDELVVNEISN